MRQMDADWCRARTTLYDDGERGSTSVYKERLKLEEKMNDTSRPAANSLTVPLCTSLDDLWLKVKVPAWAYWNASTDVTMRLLSPSRPRTELEMVGGRKSRSVVQTEPKAVKWNERGGGWCLLAKIWDC